MSFQMHKRHETQTPDEALLSLRRRSIRSIHPLLLCFLSIKLIVARPMIEKAMDKQLPQPLTRKENKALCQ